ncbi:alpha-tubulin N-acetyltransferase-like isoform X2 [Diorhabda sublineata]|nr:alpha-tubulin N-acetyltransferase-like isoform X2 [Diorhabda sublineata]
MGEASAAAQGLTKPITTADRLRNSEHKLYFLIDPNANGSKGAVTGMLKTGNKSLYVFDRDGVHYQVSPPCLLDFYVHETKQRNGLGKQLFEYMLRKENIEPVQMAIDRPSEKLLSFFNKHYSLKEPVKQMNNYVVYDGFFPSKEPDTQATNVNETRSVADVKKNSANGLQYFQSPMGRYGAPRPPCSMGQIIHNQSPTIEQRQEPTGDVQITKDVAKQQTSQKLERPRSLIIQPEESIKKEDEQIEEKELEDLGNGPSPIEDVLDSLEMGIEKLELGSVEKSKVKGTTENFLYGDEDGPSPRKTPSHLTEQGYFDLKFYHNKLW